MSVEFLVRVAASHPLEVARRVIERGQMRIFSLMTVTILVIVGISFSILNATPVSLNYYIGTSTLPLSLLLILVLLLGFMLGTLLLSLRLIKEKTKVRQLRKKQKNLEQELMNLRSIPLQD